MYIFCYGCTVTFLICWWTRHKVKKYCKTETKYIPQVGAKIILLYSSSGNNWTMQAAAGHKSSGNARRWCNGSRVAAPPGWCTGSIERLTETTIRTKNQHYIFFEHFIHLANIREVTPNMFVALLDQLRNDECSILLFRLL